MCWIQIFTKNYLIWIKSNCELKIVNSNFDLIQAIPEEARGNPVQEFLLDTVTLNQELKKFTVITD